ncbi:glucosaminidase domain-containing protein [Erwiniaceae bacterium CAU 1747]
MTKKDSFRSYDSFQDSADDFGRFLNENKRYKPAFKHADNSVEFAKSIGHAGYATDPDYGDKLVKIIKSQRLDEYDK